MGLYRFSVELPFALLAPIGLVLVVAAAFATTMGRLGRTLGVALTCSLLALPFFANPASPIYRVLLAMVGLLCALRVVDLRRGARLDGPLRLAWFALTPFDVRRTSVSRPAFDGRFAAALVGYGALSAGAVAALPQLGPPLTGFTIAPLRWFVGLVFVYAGVEAVVATIRLGYGLVGIRTPDFHRAPILSRTLSEFWGQRWNRPVHEWLERHCFMPLARRRWRVSGILAAFVASTAIHVWLALVSLDLALTAAMGGFFMVQGGLVVVERKLAVARWPAHFGHAWTALWFLLTGPLFVVPFLAVFGL